MPSIDVAAGILLSKGKVLVSERRHDPAFPGLWEFPGGKIDPGESRSGALRRELAEELGIEVCEHRLLVSLEHQYPDRHVRIDFFLVTEWLGEAIGREGQALRWIKLDQLNAEELLPADAPVVEKLRDL